MSMNKNNGAPDQVQNTFGSMKIDTTSVDVATIVDGNK